MNLRIQTVILLGLIALILPWLISDFRVFQVNLMLVYAIAVLGLNLLTGYGGQISLGHGAFYAIGAYTAAILMDQAQWSAYATLPVAALVCLAAGILMGFPALRLDGHYLALATFALAMAIPQLLKYKGIEDYTGGVQGIVLDKPLPLFEMEFLGKELSEDRWMYYLVLIVAVLMFWLANNLVKGRIG
ncbi:MAG: branched-chain amino acid ABC transporter permease, partial [Burkholderiaceae bacterium]|nr:branched-chain amino acid ABC transporter permease [Burkholderiaceae bacterium]